MSLAFFDLIYSGTLLGLVKCCIAGPKRARVVGMSCWDLAHGLVELTNGWKLEGERQRRRYPCSSSSVFIIRICRCLNGDIPKLVCFLDSMFSYSQFIQAGT